MQGAGRPGTLPSMLHVAGAEVAVITAEGAYTLLELRAPGGAALARRTHAHEDLTVHVLEGAVALDLDGEPRTLTPGAQAVIPRGTPFAGSAAPPGARLLVVAVPGGIERLVRVIADPDGGPLPDGDDLAALLAMAGVQPL